MPAVREWRKILSVLNNIAVAGRGFSAEHMTPENRELALHAMEFVEQPQDALPAEASPLKRLIFSRRWHVAQNQGPFCAKGACAIAEIHILRQGAVAPT